MPETVLPEALRRGDTIAVVSTSSGLAGALPERTARAVAALERLGFEVRMMEHALESGDPARPWVSAPAEARLADLHAAFADRSVRMVLSAIGGDHSAQLLDGLDLDLVAANPKLFCGYSDATVVLAAIHARTGLATVYGPALLPEFGEVGGPDAEVVDWLLRVVGRPEPAGVLPRVSWQASEDRAVTDADGRARVRHAGEPRRALRPGRGTGPLLAACLPSLRALVGTEWQPDTRGRVLLLEPPEAPYDVAWADADLTHLRNAGLLSGISALVLGRTDGWGARDVELLHGVALDAARGGFPVLAGVECGHSAPMLALPIGVLATVDGEDLVIEGRAVRRIGPSV